MLACSLDRDQLVDNPAVERAVSAWRHQQPGPAERIELGCGYRLVMLEGEHLGAICREVLRKLGVGYQIADNRFWKEHDTSINDTRLLRGSGRTIRTMDSQPPNDLLSPSDAAKMLGLTPAAIVAMAARGVLPTIRTAGGRRLFWRTDVERIAAVRAQGRVANEGAR